MRAEAIEELLILVGKLPISDTPDISDLQGLLLFVVTLFDDVNFKISLTALQIVTQITHSFGKATIGALPNLLEGLAKKLGDSKIVLRQAHMRLVMKLMEANGPRPVLRGLLKLALPSRHWRVREEAINIATAAMLTFPRSDLDLELSAAQLAPTLLDSKQRVRQASMESLAVLGHALGDGYLQPLVGCVSDLERQAIAPGLLNAVLARLNRRQLAQISADGLVEHSMPIATSAAAASRHGSAPDVDWILAAGSTAALSRPTSSAIPNSTCATPPVPTTPILVGANMFRPDSTQPLPADSRPISTVATTTQGDITSVPRPRFSSAGRKQLPWELPVHSSSNPPSSATSTSRDKTHSAPTMVGLPDARAEAIFFLCSLGSARFIAFQEFSFYLGFFRCMCMNLQLVSPTEGTTMLFHSLVVVKVEYSCMYRKTCFEACTFLIHC